MYTNDPVKLSDKQNAVNDEYMWIIALNCLYHLKNYAQQWSSQISDTQIAVNDEYMYGNYRTGLFISCTVSTF